MCTCPNILRTSYLHFCCLVVCAFIFYIILLFVGVYCCCITLCTLPPTPTLTIIPYYPLFFVCNAAVPSTDSTDDIAAHAASMAVLSPSTIKTSASVVMRTSHPSSITFRFRLLSRSCVFDCTCVLVYMCVFYHRNYLTSFPLFVLTSAVSNW